MENRQGNFKILIIRLSSLGDILLTGPFIRALGQYYSEADLNFLVRKEFTDALRYNPGISDVWIYEKNMNEKILIDKIKSEKYDLVIDLQNNFRSRKICRKLNSRVIKFRKPGLRKFLLVNFKINLLKNFPSIPERYASVIPEINLDGRGLDLYLPPQITQELPAGNYIGICPGAKHFTKRWPADNFVKLGNMLNAIGYRILIFGGKEDRELCSLLHDRIKNSINMSNDNELPRTAVHMKMCKAVVCNDSGLMHTASAMNVPVAAIFGSTVKEFGFFPYKVKNVILENNSLSCRPCSHIGREDCPKKHFKCMNDLTPDQVLENITQLLKL